MIDPNQTYTTDDFDLDPQRWEHYELYGGVPKELPMGQIPHSRTIARLGQLLLNWVDIDGYGSVFTSEQEVRLGSDKNIVYKTDVCWTPKQADEVPGIPNEAFPLMVEVLSDGNTTRDMEIKITDYLRYGAEEVWEIRPWSKGLIVHRRNAPPRYLGGDHLDQVYTTSLLPGFELKLSELFR